jgi:exodeoxyribonuclease VII large subunit
LLKALELANARAECDVIVLARGGGSLEDLTAFNSEALAHAIRDSAIPVVTGVGHEIDFTIADLAADRRAATPSAAAELVSPSASHLSHRLSAFEQRLIQAQETLIEHLRRRQLAVDRHLRLLHPSAALERRQQRVDELERRLADALQERFSRSFRRCELLRARLLAVTPVRRLDGLRQRATELKRRLLVSFPARILLCREQLSGLAHALDTLSPLGTLSRGYAIVRRLPGGEILRESAQVTSGDRIEAQLGRGTITARVEPGLKKGRRAQ